MGWEGSGREPTHASVGDGAWSTAVSPISLPPARIRRRKEEGLRLRSLSLQPDPPEKGEPDPPPKGGSSPRSAAAGPPSPPPLTPPRSTDQHQGTKLIDPATTTKICRRRSLVGESLERVSSDLTMSHWMSTWRVVSHSGQGGYRLMITSPPGCFRRCRLRRR